MRVEANESQRRGEVARPSPISATSSHSFIAMDGELVSLRQQPDWMPKNWLSSRVPIVYSAACEFFFKINTRKSACVCKSNPTGRKTAFSDK